MLKSTHANTPSFVVLDLQAELSALQSSSADASSLQARNHDLERELSSLKTEVFRLRSQSETHQYVLSEKLSLERQLNALEIESREAKASKSDRKRPKISKAQKGPSSKVDSEEEMEQAEEMSPVHEEENEESPEDSLPPTPKVERASRPKRTKVSAEKSDSNARSKPRKGDTKSVPLKEPQEKGSQPERVRISLDDVLMTPGGVHVSKMPQRTSAAPGDKSFFSTTPFLNRTSIDYQDTTEEDSDEHMDTTKSRPIQKPKRRNISHKASKERREASPVVEKQAKKPRVPRQQSKKTKIPDDGPDFQHSYLDEAVPDRGFRYNIGGANSASGQNMRQKIRLGRNKFIEASQISPLKRNVR